MVPRSINLVDNSEASFFVKAFTCLYFDELFVRGRGKLHAKMLNKSQWQRHTCNYYFILKLDHVSIAYSAANIVAHATF